MTRAGTSEGLDAALDHLQRERPDVVWAFASVASDRYAVLKVRDPLGRVRAGDVVRPTSDDGAVLVHPVVGQGGSAVSVLWGLDRTSSGRLDDVRDLVAVLARLVGLVARSEHAHVTTARRSQVLHEQAHTDELTGLPNRRGWSTVLESEQPTQADDEAPSVVVIDLDGLKEINDVQGHVAGDEYLQLAAATLAAVSRDSDVVARLGGDEFGVLVGGPDPDAAQPVVARIREAFEAAGVAASIGHAEYESEGGLERTWWRADQAMYAEKKKRRRARSRRPRPDPPVDGVA
ncbi:GGDEF domain-containing protein [Angustibacter peucedani]